MTHEKQDRKQLVTQIPSPELSIANLEQQLISKGVRLDEKSQVIDISGKRGRHKTRGSSLECLENGGHAASGGASTFKPTSSCLVISPFFRHFCNHLRFVIKPDTFEDKLLLQIRYPMVAALRSITKGED
jgi:hypothetical protein